MSQHYLSEEISWGGWLGVGVRAFGVDAFELTIEITFKICYNVDISLILRKGRQKCVNE